jgi:pSer/pThr/pTyr-binding forkhead associated (FHA) protein
LITFLAPSDSESRVVEATTVVDVFCHSCGHRNPAGVNFCSSCGAAMVTSSPDTSVSVSPVDNPGDLGAVETPAGLLELPRGLGMLVVQRGTDDGVRFVLENAITRAGRHPESDIFLDDITVSRRHAEFLTQAKVTTVRDVGSLNGTYVNRERIDEARLSSGDEVQIGKFKLLYLAATGE